MAAANVDVFVSCNPLRIFLPKEFKNVYLFVIQELIELQKSCRVMTKNVSNVNLCDRLRNVSFHELIVLL